MYIAGTLNHTKLYFYRLSLANIATCFNNLMYFALEEMKQTHYMDTNTIGFRESKVIYYVNGYHYNTCNFLNFYEFQKLNRSRIIIILGKFEDLEQEMETSQLAVSILFKHIFYFEEIFM